MTEFAVRMHGVTKQFGDVCAVDRLDLQIRPGETVALLGPNGAGKSTTVGLLLGLLAPTTGTVSVLDGTPAEAVAAGRIGAMLQDGGLMGGVTVGALLRLATDIYPQPRPIAELLEIADLASLADRRVDRLSGGQTQRVRFALAAAGDPDLLVLDEPTSAMDVEARRGFWRSIRRDAARGRTILFATHYLAEADEFADRVVVLAGGRLVVDATPARIKATAGGRTVRFTLDGEGTAGLDRLPGVNGVDVRGVSVILRTTDAEATLRALLRTRSRVPDLEVTGPDLEDAFLSLTS